MKLIPLARAAVLVCLGSLAIARFAAPVHAENTQADAAAYAEFKKSCSADITRMKARLVSQGEPISDAEFDGFFGSLPQQLRDSAKSEGKRLDAAFIRSTGAKMKQEAADPNNPDKGLAVMAPVVLCFLDVLIRRDAAGSGSPRPAAPPATSAKPPAAPPAAAARDGGDSPAMIMARSVCFDEIRTFEAAYAKTGKSASDAAAVIADVLKSFVPAGEDRTNAFENIEFHKKSVIAPGALPSDRHQLAVVFCAASVGAAADAGMRALDAFKAHWASERSGTFKLATPANRAPRAAAATDAAVSASPALPALPMLSRNARRACASEIKAYEEDLLASGEPADAVKSIVDDIVLTFLEDAEPRAQVVDSFDQMSRQPGANPGELKRLATSACIATMGTLWSVGMRSFSELNAHWAGRGRARFALAGHTAQPAADSCIWMDWEADGFGVPGVLRNECTFTVDLRFCVAGAKAGTPSEAIACEKGRSRFERLEPKGGVRTTLTDGPRINWVSCKSPLQPIETTAPGGAFTAVCK